MAAAAFFTDDLTLRVLAVTQGQWGERIAEHIGRFHPPSWTVKRWAAPRALPLVIDDPADFLPPTLPAATLILALGETPAVAQLIPDVARLAGASAVIAPIDRNESLPQGLASQLQTWLTDMGIASVFPKPFCSLTETTFNQPPLTVAYTDPAIRLFARHFGRPQFKITVDGDRRVSNVEVARDSACGCGKHVAQGLVGCPVAEAEFEAGMLHHHFPCLASMNQDADYNDTLMHVSGNIVRDAVKAEIKDYLEPPPYFQPMGRVETQQGANDG
jgi:hypothetical protein